MMAKRQPKILIPLVLAGMIFPCGTATAQDAAQDAQPSSRTLQQAVQQPVPAAKPALEAHRFWDRTNVELFAGVAAVRTLDYTSTRHFRARSVNEALLSNAVVDNKPLFVGIEAATAVTSIGISYLLHRKGHHKLERWVSFVHIGAAGFGDVRNYTLKNSNPSP